MFKDKIYHVRRQLKELKRWTIYLITFSFIKNNRINKACVFHVGRCGSTLLADLLNQNHNVLWDGKKISRWIVDNPKKSMSIKEFEQYIRKRSLARLKSWYCLEIEEENLSKLDFTMDDLIASLKVLGFKKIVVLERKNYLHSIISRAAAINSGIWHLKKSRLEKTEGFNLDLNRPFPHFPNLTIIQILANYSKFYKDVRERAMAYNIELLNLDFDEDISQNPMLAYNKICDSFEIAKNQVKIRFVKTIADPPNHLILNIDELNDKLNGTEFESMLK